MDYNEYSKKYIDYYIDINNLIFEYNLLDELNKKNFICNKNNNNKKIITYTYTNKFLREYKKIKKFNYVDTYLNDVKIKFLYILYEYKLLLKNTFLENFIIKDINLLIYIIYFFILYLLGDLDKHHNIFENIINIEYNNIKDEDLYMTKNVDEDIYMLKNKYEDKYKNIDEDDYWYDYNDEDKIKDENINENKYGDKYNMIHNYEDQYIDNIFKKNLKKYFLNYINIEDYKYEIYNGLKNNSNDCFMNSILQILKFTTPFYKIIIDKKCLLKYLLNNLKVNCFMNINDNIDISDKIDIKKSFNIEEMKIKFLNSLTYNMYNLYNNYNNSKNNLYDKKKFRTIFNNICEINKEGDYQPFTKTDSQEDAGEFFTYIYNNLKLETNNYLTNMFEFKYNYKQICKNCQNSEEKSEHYINNSILLALVNKNEDKSKNKSENENNKFLSITDLINNHMKDEMNDYKCIFCLHSYFIYYFLISETLGETLGEKCSDKCKIKTFIEDNYNDIQKINNIKEKINNIKEKINNKNINENKILSIIINSFKDKIENIKNDNTKDLKCNDNCDIFKMFKPYKTSKEYISFKKESEIMLIQLKRFIKTDDKTIKIEKKVIFNNELKILNTNYNLYGLCCHSGNLNIGHYWSYVLINNNWYELNDTYVNNVGNFDLLKNINNINEYVYLLFYQKSQ